MRVWAVVAAVAGCGGKDEGATDSGSATHGACGAVSSIPEMTLTGRVRDADQNWLEGVAIELQERNWAPATHGTTTSGPDGVYTVVGTDLPVVEGCWGTAVQFWVSGTAEGLAGDEPLNPVIEEAWSNGETSADLGDGLPLILYPE